MYKNKIIYGIFITLTLFLFSTSVFADYNIGKVKVTNNLGTGDIRISIKEYEADRNTEYNTNIPKIVLPGQKVDKVVQILNEAESAYIRIKADFYTDATNFNMDTSMLIFSDEERWKKVGDYWYYLEPIDNNNYAEFISGFRIPNFLQNEVSGETFGLYFTAEAVQSAHFTPNFYDEIDPWNGTVVEYCVHEEPYTYYEEGESVFEIQYRGGAEGIVRMVDSEDNEDDFFQNWARMMPGDEFIGEFKITDNYNLPVSIWFSTESDIEDELISTLTLTITDDEGSVIFNGPMSTIIDNPINLGEFNVGSEKILTYKVSIPTWLKNNYSLLDTHTIWVFQVYTDSGLPETGGMGLRYIMIVFGMIFVILSLKCIRSIKVGEKYEK